MTCSKLISPFGIVTRACMYSLLPAVEKKSSLAYHAGELVPSARTSTPHEK